MTASKKCPHPDCTTKIESKAKFCIRHASRKGIRPPITVRNKYCDICKSPFETTNPRQRFCVECRDTNCVVCGAHFHRRFRGGKIAVTCSDSCASKWASRNRVRQTLLCRYCGVAFSPVSGHLKVKYCSRNCKTLASRKYGPDNKRTSRKYRLWRNAVFERDNYACQDCGASDEIQAHHIKYWEKFPRLRYELSNGKTLCRTCHENIHGAKIPRAHKPTVFTCANCGCTTKGKSQYCRSCALKLSPKAIAAHQKRRLPLAFCRDCNKQITGHGQTGLCGSCCKLLSNRLK